MPVKRFFPTSVSHPITGARLHSTNPLERLHKEVKRCTKPLASLVPPTNCDGVDASNSNFGFLQRSVLPAFLS